MAYEKQNWKTGDVVTSTKLNHMEDGIAEGGSGGTPIINTTRTVGSNYSTVFTFDKTFAEIQAMLDDGSIPVVKCVYETETDDRTMYYPVYGTGKYEDDNYFVKMQGMYEGYYTVVEAEAETTSSYPAYVERPLT